MRRLISPISGLLLVVLLAGTGLALDEPNRQERRQPEIVIVNVNAAGVGFNDPTPAAPVGGNNGATLGAQRLIAFQTAAAIWASRISTSVPIRIQASMVPLACTATSAVLGSAGPLQIFADFPGAEERDTWYTVALANKMARQDLAPPSDPPSPFTDDIRARFNSNLGNTGCLTGTHFYLGLDGNHGTDIDFLAVLLHEFAHGLGFISFVDLGTGQNCCASANPPAPDDPIFPDIMGRNTFDDTANKFWDQMTAAERFASIRNSRQVVFTGEHVTENAPQVLVAGTPLLKVNSPAAIAGSYDVGPASFGPAIAAPGVTGDVAYVAANNLACAPFAPGTFTGKVALVDRGTCTFVVKVKNAQDAGATAVLVADNVAATPPGGLGGADPTITIPSARITLATGNLIKGQLGTGVNVTLGVDLTRLAGADPLGRVLLYTPNPIEGGSSVSHWDTIAFKNLLMEPFINGDLTHFLQAPNDLTREFMKDIGW